MSDSASSRGAFSTIVSACATFCEAAADTACSTSSPYSGKVLNSCTGLAATDANSDCARHSSAMNGLAASRPAATTSSVGAVAPARIRFTVEGVASASTIMIATSSPTTRPATTMSKVASSSCE